MTSPVTQLLDRAQARWAALGTAAPDLAPAITLQRALVNRTIDTVDRLRRLDRPVLNLEPGLAATKLRASTPVLRGEVLELPVDLLGPLVFQACDDLASGSAGEVAQRVRNCLDAGRIDVPSLLIASFDRNQSAIRIKAMHEGIAPDVLWLAAELAVGPAAHVAQRVVFTPEGQQLASAVTGALDAWPHGYCPACGSWPAFAEDLDAVSLLRCSFCGFQWRLDFAGCTYCGDGPDQLSSASVVTGAPHRAQLCRGCGAYLKRLTVTSPTPFELLPIEDLASTGLDVLAAEQGFGRPSLPDLDGRLERYPCENVQSTR
ncbi:MAG: formate dehydrogenase accessory protein FdhE [Vicinamibacterales bacterium]|nr:formate dehydrogenase accessory protein FdhE [Vicinamibacterales bacterium]